MTMPAHCRRPTVSTARLIARMTVRLTLLRNCALRHYGIRQGRHDGGQHDAGKQNRHTPDAAGHSHQFIPFAR